MSHVPSSPILSRDAIPRWDLTLDPTCERPHDFWGNARHCYRARGCGFLARSEERADFVVDLVGVIDGGGDLLAKQDAVSAAKAMDGDPDRASLVPSRERRRVRIGLRGTGEHGTKLVENRRSPGSIVLTAKLIEDPSQQRQAQVRSKIRSGVSSWDGSREYRPSASATSIDRAVLPPPRLRAAPARARRRDVWRRRSAESRGTGPGRGRPWPAGLAPGRRRRNPGSSLGLARVCGLAPDIGVDGIPVRLAQVGKGLKGLWASGFPAASTRLQ